MWIFYIVFMKKINRRDYNIIVEKDDEGFYIASVPELPGCYTQARSLDKLMERIKEAIELCLEVEQPKKRRTQFVGVQRLTI